MLPATFSLFLSPVLPPCIPPLSFSVSHLSASLISLANSFRSQFLKKDEEKDRIKYKKSCAHTPEITKWFCERLQFNVLNAKMYICTPFLSCCFFSSTCLLFNHLQLFLLHPPHHLFSQSALLFPSLQLPSLFCQAFSLSVFSSFSLYLI